MIIKSMELEQFRNYEHINIVFDARTNILFGDNAQGKTNILEAAYMSGTSKSHKGAKDKDMIRFGNDEAHIRTIIEKDEREYQIDLHLRAGRKKGIAINQIPVKRAAELLGILNIVVFSPEDLNIIKNGPAERRRFIDIELCQLDKIYLSDLGNYQKIITQRNKLLKDLFLHPELLPTLEVWDQQLLEYGRRVIRKREAFVEELRPIIQQIHSNITGQKEDIELCYEPNVQEHEFVEKLRGYRERDCRLAQTCVGPHKDDLSFQVNGVDIRTFGSQGQQRTAALSLKLSEIELVRRKIGDMPVLMLDDVLSELDSSRQNYLLNSISDIQTIITCTGVEEFVKNRFEINKVFQVIEGQIFENQGNYSGQA